MVYTLPNIFHVIWSPVASLALSYPNTFGVCQIPCFWSFVFCIVHVKPHLYEFRCCQTQSIPSLDIHWSNESVAKLVQHSLSPTHFGIQAHSKKRVWTTFVNTPSFHFRVCVSEFYRHSPTACWLNQVLFYLSRSSFFIKFKPNNFKSYLNLLQPTSIGTWAASHHIFLWTKLPE